MSRVRTVADGTGNSEGPSFGQLLRRYRGIVGITQETLAERSGLSAHAISSLERGVRYAPRSSTVKRLAGALGLSPSELAALMAAKGQRGDDAAEPVAGNGSGLEPAPDAAGGQDPGAGQLERAADELAGQVWQQWIREAGERRLRSPRPIPVRWRLSSLPVAGPVADAVGDDEWPRFPPLPGLAAVTEGTLAAGGLKDLLAVYGGLDSGRLIILGEPGAGKTTAAIRVLLAALDHRKALPGPKRSLVPVPVLLTARGWDPTTEPLTSWLAARVAAEHPSLRRRGRGQDLVVELVRGGRLALIVDGLDELPPGLRSTALHALSEQATFRVVVLIRSQELVEAAARHHLPGAAALELQPVDPRDAADYLGRCRPRPLPASWRQLLDETRSRPDGPLATALRTPLALTLVRDTYGPGDPVDELLDRDRFDCPEAITDHLLDRVLLAAYAPRPGQPGPPFSLAEAQRCLGFIADRMSRESTAGDLAWWLVPGWAPAWPRWLVTILAVVLAGAAAGLLAGGPAGALAVGGPVGLAAALALPRWNRPPRQVGRPSWGRVLSRANLALGLVSGLTAGLAFGVAAGLAVGFAVGLAVGLTAGLVVGLCCGLLFGLVDGLGQPTAGPASPIDPVTCWRRDRRYGAGLPLVFAAAGAATGGLAWRLTGWLDQNVAGSLLAGLASGLAGGVALGLTGAAAGRSALLGRVASGPARTVAFGLTLGLASGAAAALANGVASGLLFGLALGLGFGLAVAAGDSAAWPAALAFAQLWWSGRTPLRLVRFLEDARRRHVLRVAGPVYQFRHARLQERLARAYSVRSGGGAVSRPSQVDPG